MSTTYFAQKISSRGNKYSHYTPYFAEACNIAHQYAVNHPHHWIRLGATHHSSDYIFYAPERYTNEIKDQILIYWDEELVYKCTLFQDLKDWAKHNYQEQLSLRRILLYNVYGVRTTNLYFSSISPLMSRIFYQFDLSFRFFNPHEAKPLQINWQQEGF